MVDQEDPLSKLSSEERALAVAFAKNLGYDQITPAVVEKIKDSLIMFAVIVIIFKVVLYMVIVAASAVAMYGYFNHNQPAMILGIIFTIIALVLE
ncbi:MAG TPA: hypothetical protein VL401_00910 [Alphaproteobacteria bacterium]|jgi:hypothetical protein|nr:hypothetical protein [Alphaproteobacteria bacterium]